MANGFIIGQALDGTMIGKVDIGGTIKDPFAHFELSSQNLTAMTHKGPMSININARGSYKIDISY